MIIDNLLQTELLYKYRNSEKKIILLDYDGTLVDYKPKPDQAIPPEYLLNILSRLAKKKGTEVIIISGRDYQEIETLLGNLSVDIIAGHGAMVKEHGKWKTRVPGDVRWKDTIRPVLEQMSLKCSDSFVEDKLFSLAWHYRKAGQNPGYEYSRELIKVVEKFRESLGLKILDGNMVVEIMNQEIGKGIAVKKFLARKDYDLIFSIGDDVTDEEIFALFLPENKAVTIKVGNGSSFAKYSFESVSDVVLFLNQLSA